MDVQETVRTRGAEDLLQAIAELPAEELEAAWTRKRRPRNVGRGKQSRHRYIDRAIARWHEGTVDTAWAASAIRWALSLPAPAPGPRGRPAFQPGNRLAVIHGANSEREISARLPDAVERVRSALAEEVASPHPSDDIRLREVARTLVRIEMLDSFLDQEGGILDGNGRPLAAMGLRLSLANLLERQMTGLGLGPMARARLHADKASGARDALLVQRQLRQDYGA